MNIEIDKLTPCLEKISTGRIVDTVYSKASGDELNDLRGWNFKWSEIPCEKFEIFKLNVENDDRIQGLIAIENVVPDKAVYVKIAESAPIILEILKNI